MPQAKILVVEDEAITVMHIKKTLESMDFEVVSTASKGMEAVEKAGNLKPDLVLMDIVLKDKMDGIEAADKIQTLFDIPVIYLTAYSDEGTYERAKLTKPYGFLTKPINSDVVKVTIETAIYKHDLDKQLAESEEQYRLILETARSGVFYTDSDNKIKYLNQNMAEELGYPMHEMLNAEITEFMDKSSQNSFKFMNEWKNGKNRVNEFKLIRKDGSSFWALISASPVLNNNDEYLGVIGVITDINARKAFEKAIVEQGKRSEVALFRFTKILNDLIKKTENKNEISEEFDFEFT
jgi:PAS domain S-box-containing protein